MSFRVLSVYPKKHATQLGLFIGKDERIRREIRHDAAELGRYDSIVSQWHHRLRALEDILAEPEVDRELSPLDAVVGPAGVLGQVPGGVYSVDKDLIERVALPEPFEHPSDLGASLADALGRRRNAYAFVAHPLSTDECDPVCKVSGLPELDFGRRMHTLNIKEAVHRASEQLGVPFEEISVVVAHLGKNFSICAHRRGRAADLANACERGPFSPSFCGSVPAADLIRMAYSGMWSEDDLVKKTCVTGGMSGYIGSDILSDLAMRIVHGDGRASLVFRTMAYQIAQEIAAQATVLKGKVDAIICTGGCAYDQVFLEVIRERIGWIAPMLVYPGEDELRAMAAAAVRVLDGREKALTYGEVASGGAIGM